MITETTDDRRHFGTSCDQCCEEVIAPDRSEYVGKYLVRHIWSCENCGHEFQMSINVLGYRNEIHPVDSRAV